MSRSEGIPIETDRGPAAMAPDKRRLAAILVADVVGYSRLMHDDDDGTLAALTAHRHELVEPEIARHDGRLANTAGDSLVVEFGSVVEAVSCAVEIQRQMPGRNADIPPERRVQFRIGISLGEIIGRAGDIFGDGVNTAARLQQLARPNEICVSADAYRQVRGKLDVQFEDLGEHVGKNLPEPLRVFRIVPGTGKVGPAPAKVVQTVPAQVAGRLIAVLPFGNLSGDPGRDYFSDGITNDLITDLSRFPDLAVIASHSVFAYKGKPVTIETVARELGVRYVVEGSVQHAGDRVRINAQLIDTLTDRHLWSHRYNRDLQDLFAVQDEIAHSIAATVFRRLELLEREHALRKPTDSLEAYDHFLRGQAVWYGWTSESNAEARAHFRKAIELDPNFARAYGALSYTMVQAALEGWLDNPEAALREARNLAQIAVARGPSDFENLEHLGFACLYCREFDRSLAYYEQALELNPNSADLLADMADMLAHLGRTAEAVAQINRAKRLNPICPDWYDWVLGIAAFHDGRYEDALAAFTRAGTQSTFMLREMVATYVRLGRLDEARALAREVLQRQPGYRLATESIRPFRDPKVLEAFIADLRRAGLPG
jgi:adenylate cyclase